MASNNAAKAAEKITDEQLLARVQELVETSNAPFVTTKQADDSIDELKDDQVRRRLKSLADDEEQLAYAHPRGLVFWLPEDVELSGEVSLDSTVADGINWGEIEIEDLPPDLLEAAAEAHTEEMTTPRWIADISQTAMSIALFFLSLGFVGALYEELILEGTLSPSQQDLVLLCLGIGFLGFMIGTLLVIIGKTLGWMASNEWIQSKLEEY